MSVELGVTAIAPLPALDLDGLVAQRARAVDPALEPAFRSHGEGERNLQRLFTDGALCVTTGQQPGLFTGPLYTVYKGLSAIALARTLEAQLDRPVVPVYWVAGDDHDLAEANHIHLLTQTNAVEQVTLRERAPDDPLIPLYREPLGERLAHAFEALVGATPHTEFREEVLRWLRRHYVPERDFGSAFAGAVAELLGPLGLVVFEPTDVSAKTAMMPYVLTALQQAESLNRSLAERTESLRARGMTPPVTVGDGATTVMCECELGRDRLVLANGRFEARRSGHSWTLDDLRQVARDDPARLSPNVLLRPVIEAALLPTLAYVAGPGELAYLPQCEPIYRALDVTPQAAVPRWSGRIVEAKIAKVLEKYGIGAEALDRPEGQLEAALLRDEMPAAGTDAMEALRRAIDQEYARLQEAAESIDPTLRKTVQHAKNAAFKDLADVEKKLISHLKKQNEIVVQQLDKARRNLFPLGRPQERVFNVSPYLVRYGRGLLDQILEQAAQYYSALSGATRGA